MCLVALALEHSRRFPLVIAANRDEYFRRATAPLDWWTPDGGGPPILAGRDLEAGGTWMGLTAQGRLALVTNVRDPARHDPAAPSRGRIVQEWLAGGEPVEAFWTRTARGGHNGFNLIAFDLRRGERFFASNHGHAPRALGPGIHGLSNATLDTPWPKVTALATRLREAVDACASVDALAARLFQALADPQEAPDEALPRTGIPLERERQLSAAFIRTPDGLYGTRSSMLVIAEDTGGRRRTHVIERTHDAPAGAPAPRHAVLEDWPPAPAGHDAVQGARTIST